MVQSQALPSMTIGKLAAAGGVGVETVRFYQRKGLLPQPQRNGGVRRYGGEELRRLQFIRRAQAAGFTLEEIAELLALDASLDRARGHALALSRIAQLNDRIALLEETRDRLQLLANECGSGRAGPCPIIASFEQ